MNENQPTKKREKQRDVLNKFIDRPAEFLIKHKITPNILSFLGFSCMVGAAIAIGLGTIHMNLLVSWIGPFLIFISGTFDIFDGEVARRTGKEGPAGAFLDSVLDRLSDAVLILGLVYGGLINYFWGFVILFLCIMISYIRSRAESEGVEMRGIGLMERAERILYLFTILIIETWAYLIASWTTGQQDFVFIPYLTAVPVTWWWIITILLYIGALGFTLAQRIVFTFKNLKTI